MRPEIDDLMPRPVELSDQFFLQAKATVIRRDSNAHVAFSVCDFVPLPWPFLGIATRTPNQRST
jgi:hypothetical protein